MKKTFHYEGPAGEEFLAAATKAGLIAQPSPTEPCRHLTGICQECVEADKRRTGHVGSGLNWSAPSPQPSDDRTERVSFDAMLFAFDFNNEPTKDVTYFLGDKLSGSVTVPDAVAEQLESARYRITFQKIGELSAEPPTDGRTECVCGHRQAVHERRGPADFCLGCKDSDIPDEQCCYDFTPSPEPPTEQEDEAAFCDPTLGNLLHCETHDSSIWFCVGRLSAKLREYERKHRKPPYLDGSVRGSY